MSNKLDLRQDAQYDLVINKDRDLDVSLTAEYYSGTSENYQLVDFSFDTYTGATLQVKKRPDSQYTVLEFSTEDGSIVLPASGNVFKLKKTAEQLTNLRAGDNYHYDMYLSSATYNKRAFLSGSMIIENRITE